MLILKCDRCKTDKSFQVEENKSYEIISDIYEQCNFYIIPHPGYNKIGIRDLCSGCYQTIMKGIQKREVKQNDDQKHGEDESPPRSENDGGNDGKIQTDSRSNSPVQRRKGQHKQRKTYAKSV